MKKKVLVIGIIAILIACLALGTFAYLVVEGIATNVVSFGTVKLDLTEQELNAGVLKDYPIVKKDIFPDMTVSKVPIVENTGTEPFYTRMFIQIKAVDANGEPLTDVADCVMLHNDEDSWNQKEEDAWFLTQNDWIIDVVESGEEGYEEGTYTAWYYYNGTVEPDQKVAPFNIVEFTGAIGNDYLGATITVTLCAQAVQSEHNPMTGSDVTTVQGWPALPDGEQ